MIDIALFRHPMVFIPSLLAVMMLGFPTQLTAQILSQTGDDDALIMIYVCGDIAPMPSELNDHMPVKKPTSPHDCCKTACHAGLDRKKKERHNGCC